MVKIGTAIARTGRTAAGFIKRARVVGMASIFQIHRPAAGKSLYGSSSPCWQNTIKHINPARHSANKIGWLANPHQIARLVLPHQRRCNLKRLKHRLLPLANGKTANGIAFEINFLKRSNRFSSQIRKYLPLDNAKLAITGSCLKCAT